MIDSGLTLHYINRSLSLRRPRSLEVCILFDRPQLRLVDIDVRYRGFEVPDDFFVGYGFDYRQLFRNLPYVAYLKTGARPTDPLLRPLVIGARRPPFAFAPPRAGAGRPTLELAATLLPALDAPERGRPAPGPGGGPRRRQPSGRATTASAGKPAAQGFAVLALDFRGHGDSAGAADGPLEQDILAAADFLRDASGRGSALGSAIGARAWAGSTGSRLRPQAGFAAAGPALPGRASR